MTTTHPKRVATLGNSKTTRPPYIRGLCNLEHRQTLVPAMGRTALWLWRERTIAYALAGALLAFVALITLAIGAMMVAMSLYGQPVAIGMSAVFGSVSAVSLGMLIWYMLGLIGS